MPEYDIFELFPDGAFVWRAFVSGTHNKERTLQDLSETSANRFYAVDIAAGETLPLIEPRHAARPEKDVLKKTG